nr:hypothetical protein [Escherichia coli]
MHEISHPVTAGNVDILPPQTILQFTEKAERVSPRVIFSVTSRFHDRLIISVGASKTAAVS